MWAATFTGSLSGTGLEVGGDWTGAELSWVVSQDGTQWSYEYTIRTPEHATSHFIVETSPGFAVDNFLSPELDFEVGTFANGKSNPGMPGGLLGVKVQDFEDVVGLWTDASGAPLGEQVVITVLSDKTPVWGDFYAKGSSDCFLYNAGFSLDDPTAAASSGSIDFHVLRPDTAVVPLPGAVLLAALGLGCVAWCFRREFPAV